MEWVTGPARAVNPAVRRIKLMQGMAAYLYNCNNKCIKWELLKEGSQLHRKTVIRPQVEIVQLSLTLSWSGETSYYLRLNQCWPWNQWKGEESRFQVQQILHLRHITVIINKRLTTLISISSNSFRIVPISNIQWICIMLDMDIHLNIILTLLVLLLR